MLNLERVCDCCEEVKEIRLYELRDNLTDCYISSEELCEECAENNECSCSLI